MQRFVLAASALPGLGGHALAGAVRAGERVFLSGANALRPDGSIVGPGDAGAQAHAALDQLEAALAAAGGSLADITKLTTCVVDRDFRRPIYAAIAERLGGARPVSTGLVVAGLALPEMIVQIDAEAAIPTAAPRHTRPYDFDDWHGQGFSWRGAMVLATDQEFFLRGQTGSGLDHSGIKARGRSAADVGAQADLALANMQLLLAEAGASLQDIVKLSVYISDRAYRPTVYPAIGRHLAGVRPVSTGIVTTGFARPDVLVEIDATVLRPQGGQPHRRLRPYHSSAARYGTEAQKLDCEFCMAVLAGRRVTLRGQTGVGLDEVLRGAGDAARQADQAMDNVETLLAEADAGLADIAKATIYVTDRAHLAAVNAAITRRLGDAAPAATSVIVKGLASAELLMEIDIVAFRPDAG